MKKMFSVRELATANAPERSGRQWRSLFLVSSEWWKGNPDRMG